MQVPRRFHQARDSVGEGLRIRTLMTRVTMPPPFAHLPQQ